MGRRAPGTRCVSAQKVSQQFVSSTMLSIGFLPGESSSFLASSTHCYVGYFSLFILPVFFLSDATHT
jgi:hypothetical protein